MCKTKMKILNCYLFSILNYGCESWTWNKAMAMKVNGFDMSYHRRILITEDNLSGQCN